MKKTKIEKIVIKLLSKKVGKKGFMLRNEIMYKTDIEYDPLSFRELIKGLRNKGYPIIANCQLGYKLAKNGEELADYCVARIREINDERHTLDNMQKGAK